jgi:uncharacterized protein YjbI with pentapeptide repeats
MGAKLRLLLMVDRFQRRLSKIRKPLVTIVEFIGLILLLVVVIALIFVEVKLYGTGFNGYTTIISTKTINGLSPPTITRTIETQPGKTLWDWLQLLIIPVVLAVAGFSITRLRDQTDRNIATDRLRQVALQEYLDRMSELLLKENLRKSEPDAEVRNIARARTLTVLSGLDADRKSSIIQFLSNSRVISFIDLSEADLTGVHFDFGKMSMAKLSGAKLNGGFFDGTDLSEADLHYAELRSAGLSSTNLRNANLSVSDLSKSYLTGADLNGADLSEADLKNTFLFFAKLIDANLRGADLSGANLYLADLSGADMDGADLTKAIVTTLQLDQAKSLKGATMPDGSIHT